MAIRNARQQAETLRTEESAESEWTALAARRHGFRESQPNKLASFGDYFSGRAETGHSLPSLPICFPPEKGLLWGRKPISLSVCAKGGRGR